MERYRVSAASSRRTGRWRPALGLGFILVLVALVLSACGGGGGGSTEAATTEAATSGSGEEGGGDAKSKEIAAAEASLERQYKGVAMETATEGPAAKKGLNAWYVSCGQTVSGCVEATNGFKEAAKALGWKLTVVDGKFDPNTVASAIDQAVAAKADVIGINVFDCGAIKTALEKAKSAGIPLVSTWSEDCEQPLFAGITSFASEPTAQGFSTYAGEKLNWAVVKTGGDMKLIDLYETDLSSTRIQERGLQKTLSECPETCEVVETVEFTANDLGNLQELISAALTRNPDANAIYFPYGGLFPAGGQAAIKQSGRQSSLNVIGGACEEPEMAMFEEGGWNLACSGYSQAWTGWMCAEYLNRLASGEASTSLPEAGIGYQLVDSEHNLPEAGKPWEPTVDFRANMEQIWAG